MSTVDAADARDNAAVTFSADELDTLDDTRLVEDTAVVLVVGGESSAPDVTVLFLTAATYTGPVIRDAVG